MREALFSLLISFQLSNERTQALIALGVAPEVIGIKACPRTAGPAHMEVRRLAWLTDNFRITHWASFFLDAAHDAAPSLNNDPVAGLNFGTY